MSEVFTPRQPSRRHTISPGSCTRQPLSEIIQRYEKGNSTHKSNLSQDDLSVLSPTPSDGTEKENIVNTGQVSEIVQKFRGKSVVKTQEAFFKTLLEQRKTNIISSQPSVAINAVKAMNSPVKAEFMKAWVDDVLAEGNSSPSLNQAKDFLADYGVTENETGREEWSDWSDAIKAAQQHGANSEWISPLAQNHSSILDPAVKMTRSAVAYNAELDSSIDMCTTLGTEVIQGHSKAQEGNISFDVDDGAQYSDHMMSMYPHDENSERAFRIESTSSDNSNKLQAILCPVVKLPHSSKTDTSDGSNRHQDFPGTSSENVKNKTEKNPAPSSCSSSWFKFFKCF